MIRSILIATFALLCTSASAQSVLDRKVDGHVGYNTGLVADVPQGLDKPYLSVCVDDDWQQRPDQARVVAWFSQSSRLGSARLKWHFNLYTRSNPHFRQVLAPAVGTAFPIVLLQHGGRPNTPPLGLVAMNCTAASMPTSPDALADAVWLALNQMSAAPRFDGQQSFTPIVDDVSAEPTWPCPPNQPCPVDVPDESQQIPVVMPSPAVPASGVAATFGVLAAAAGGLYLVNRRPPTASLLPRS